MAEAARKLRPISKPEELASVPVNEPVLVELPEGVTAFDGSNVETKEKPAAEQGAEQLQSQLEQLKAADKQRQEALSRSQAETAKERQRAAAAEAEAQRIREREAKSTKEFFGTALEGAQAEKAAAKIALQQAYTAGDAAGVADAQDRLSTAAAKLVHLESASADYDAAPVQQPQTEQQQPIDLMAQVESRPDLLPEEKSWLKAHPEVILDQRRNAELGVAYDRAVRKGLQRGTPAYFKFLNEFLEYEQPTKSNDTNDDRTLTEEVAVAAPVSRGEPSGSQNDRRVTLTPEQRELARSMGLTDIQYAEGVLRLRIEKQENPEKYGRVS